MKVPHIKPMLATLVEKTPLGNGWIHEIKWDGYRVLCYISKKAIIIYTRNGNNWTHKFPDIVQSLKKFPFKDTLLDGELVVLDKRGYSQFQLLQNAINEEKSNQVKYFVFDMPYYKGNYIGNLKLLERKKYLKTCFKLWKNHSNIVLTQYIAGNGEKVYKNACENRLEGVISKQKLSYYEQKRSKQWVKTKCGYRQEFVIIGYTKPKGTRRHLGALLLGCYQGKTLVYCGKVGTGFSQETLKNLYEKLSVLKLKKQEVKIDIPISVKDVQWVKPKYVGELTFTEWTDKNLLRHPSFLGLRLDKNARTVKMEKL